MKNNPDGQNASAFIRKLLPSGIRKGPALAWTGAFLLCLAVILLSQASGGNAGGIAYDLRAVLADTLFLLLLFSLLWYFCGSRTVGRSLRNSEVYLVSGLSALYIAGSVLIKNIPLDSFPLAVVVPTALVMMLPSILIHARLALVLAMALPLGAFLTGSFDTASYVFALVSGVVAAYSLQGAEKRMDLVKAGLVIAAANLLAMTAVLLWQRFPAGAYPYALFWAGFNGIASGMLVLGVLPPLENALNASTSFRLIELSDLNAPILRRLFTTAPGTYSHSILVANLAEAACLDIGANPLLTRVGAYYHDLGKMENPDYFVENQTDYNRHDDMAPRLSATVIRSHVKLGVEKARQLRLPGEVLNIINEHHGNSVISWFYDKAIKQEGKNPKKAPVNTEDFCYPGIPPRSRESAVVMLADVTEAAVRTLEKPTAVKIEKFIQELTAKKVEQGQLAQCELTFRDLEKIKNAFVRVLVAYYHSRIEYPKPEQADEAAKQ
ncbi:MAG: HDIG domain-containing protein [Treponema sp.]|nr:HDIG domain-containing protein [Treponema sp.]